MHAGEKHIHIERKGERERKRERKRGIRMLIPLFLVNEDSHELYIFPPETTAWGKCGKI